MRGVTTVPPDVAPHGPRTDGIDAEYVTATNSTLVTLGGDQLY